MTKIILCDLDNTLANIDHRLHHVRNGKRNWEEFFAGILDDSIHIPVLDIIRAFKLANRPKVFFVSGRPEKTRNATQQWLLNNCGLDTYGNTLHRLYMRADGDHRPDTVIKSEILDRLISEGYEITFVIDDRPAVCAMWRSRGIFVFQVNADRWEEPESDNQGLLTLMVGPTGAGKSTFLFDVCNFKSDEQFGIKQSQIVSSDQIRSELCGDFRDQSKNDQVFQALHALAGARIQNGLDCVVDATNLHRKDRRAIIDACGATRVRYLVLDRPLEEKLLTAGWRAGVPGLIEKHHQRFQSALQDILSGDGIAEVIDLRRTQ